MSGKKIALWYTHKNIDLKLRLAEKFAHIIFSASKESFRYPSMKLTVTGHGIDTETYKPPHEKNEERMLNILSVGRISPIKGQETIIEAAHLLEEEGLSVRLTFIGSPGSDEDRAYAHVLDEKVAAYGLDGTVAFIGAMRPEETVSYFQQADVCVNASTSGGLDKVILEAMACGTLSLSSSDSAASLLGRFDERLVFEKGNARDLAKKIYTIARMDIASRVALGQKLRSEVVAHHSLPSLVRELVRRMEAI
jgi:glycosyltransferase involved in cell wall biosynthesis